MSATYQLLCISLFVLFLVSAVYCSDNEGFLAKLKALNERTLKAKKNTDTINGRLDNVNFQIVDAEALGVVLDIRYATTNNEAGKIIYKKPLLILHKDSIEALKISIKIADSLGYLIKIFDGFRPMECQKIIYETFPDKEYVSNPQTGRSDHTRGLAIDLTLVNKDTKKELDMGTGFDAPTPLSSSSATNGLTAQQIHNRMALAGIMSAGGFLVLDKEWWHFTLATPVDTKQYPVRYDHSLKTGIFINE